MNRCCAVLLGLVVSLGTVSADSATWLVAPGNGDWNTGANWTLGGPPNGPADIATFQFSTVTAVSISTDTEINEIAFQPGASGFAITAGSNFRLTISGAGITNNSGSMQNFLAAGNGGAIRFANAASAGSNTAFTTDGGVSSGEDFGVTEFRDISSAGAATFTTNGGAAVGAFGGVTQFFDRSSAGNGNFTNNGPVVSGAGRGVTLFFDRSTAGNAAFTNNGGQSAGGLASFTFFFDHASAAHGTFTTNGAGAPFAEGGSTQFFDNSSAGDGIFFINAGSINGGTMGFFDDSTAERGTFVTSGGQLSGEGGGRILFSDRSSAGDGTFTTNGAAVGAQVGRMEFRDNSSAGNATFTTNGGGSIEFGGSATAGSATFTINGGTFRGEGGGIAVFFFGSNAGDGTLTVNGGTGDGAGSGRIIFESANAANAILIANGGTDGGDGGSIQFGIDSTGGTAQAKLFGNGQLDISIQFGTFYDPQHDPGLTIGSLEGTGMVFLGANRLTVGSSDLSTTFSGLIQDGGIQGTTGGSFAKVGTGTLTLASANTYTGGTLINAGTIASGAPASFGSGSVTLNGGTLRLDGANRSVNAASDYVQNGGTLELRIGGKVEGVNSDILLVGVNNGSATINPGSTLSLLSQNGFVLSSSDRITLLETENGLSGAFSTVLGLDAFSLGGTILFPAIRYDAFHVYLVLAQRDFRALPSLTPNQHSVADNLDEALGDPAFDDLNDFLVNQPLSALPAVFDLIAPEELSAIYEIGFSQANTQTANLQRRLREIRAGSTGFSAAGHALAGGKGPEALGGNVLDQKEAATPSMMDARPENRWGVFVTGSGQLVDAGGDFNAPGYEITSGGLTFGIDYRVNQSFALGLYGGYAHGEVDLVAEGNIDADGGKLGAYATFHRGAFYIDGATGGGFNHYDTQRAALLGRAHGETDGREFNGLIATGLNWQFAGFHFGPAASLQYTNVRFDDFTERGSLAPLRIDGRDEHSLASTLGVKVARNWTGLWPRQRLAQRRAFRRME